MKQQVRSFLLYDSANSKKKNQKDWFVQISIYRVVYENENFDWLFLLRGTDSEMSPQNLWPAVGHSGERLKKTVLIGCSLTALPITCIFYRRFSVVKKFPISPGDLPLAKTVCQVRTKYQTSRTAVCMANTKRCILGTYPTTVGGKRG